MSKKIFTQAQIWNIMDAEYVKLSMYPMYDKIPYHLVSKSNKRLCRFINHLNDYNDPDILALWIMSEFMPFDAYPDDTIQLVENIGMALHTKATTQNFNNKLRGYF